MDTVDTEVVQPRAETDGFKKVSRRKKKKKKRKKSRRWQQRFSRCAPTPVPRRKVQW